MVGPVMQGYSCKCGGPGTVSESFHASELIVHGNIVCLDTIRVPQTIRQEDVPVVKEMLKSKQNSLQFFEMLTVIRVEIEIIENFKGQLDNRHAVIHTPFFSASCGYRFEKDKSYIVYANRQNPFSYFFEEANVRQVIGKSENFWTSHCTRTAIFDPCEADELRGNMDRCGVQYWFVLFRS